MTFEKFNIQEIAIINVDKLENKYASQRYNGNFWKPKVFKNWADFDKEISSLFKRYNNSFVAIMVTFPHGYKEKIIIRVDDYADGNTRYDWNYELMDSKISRLVESVIFRIVKENKLKSDESKKEWVDFDKAQIEKHEKQDAFLDEIRAKCVKIAKAKKLDIEPEFSFFDKYIVTGFKLVGNEHVFQLRNISIPFKILKNYTIEPTSYRPYEVHEGLKDAEIRWMGEYETFEDAFDTIMKKSPKVTETIYNVSLPEKRNRIMTESEHKTAMEETLDAPSVSKAQEVINDLKTALKYIKDTEKLKKYTSLVADLELAAKYTK